MTEPTDAELEALAEEHLDATYQFGRLWLEGQAAFARAVLAKWGTPPAVAGEPVAWRYRMKGDLQWQYTERQEQFAHADEVQPLDTPQPTQAQAGAVPLTVRMIKEICRQHITRDKSKDEPDTGSWPDSVALARAIEAAHGIGIKGGQHGADT